MQSEIGARVSADMGVGTVPIRPLCNGRCLTAETVKAATVHVSIDGIGRAGFVHRPKRPSLCGPGRTCGLCPWSVSGERQPRDWLRGELCSLCIALATLLAPSLM